MLFNNITLFADKHHLLPSNSTIIIGLSGGPDSVLLLHYLHNIAQKRNLTLIGAHLDHEWRENSNDDTIFCKKLCDKLGITFITKKASELQGTFKKSGSLEELGRNMRRHFFFELQNTHNAQFIALAHHADDQQETFFIRLVRGTSLSGICGMRPLADTIIRPLLETSKKTIITYLDEQAIPYLIDPTNELPHFLRNRIRQNVIPALRACDTRFDKNFIQTLSHLQAAEDTLEGITLSLYDEISIITNNQKGLDISKLLAFNSYVCNRILMHWLISHNAIFTPSEKFFSEIIRFLKKPESKDHQLHQTWRLRKKKNVVWLLFENK